MTARRLLATAGRLSVVGVAALALTGCEKPAPIVTVVSGTTSEWKEADVYCFEGQSLTDDQCVQRAEEPTRIEVSPGDRVGVDVDEDVVERGWYLELGGAGGEGEVQASDIQLERHYFAFTAPALGPDGLRLTVKAVGEDGPRGPHSGEWVFELVPE